MSALPEFPAGDYRADDVRAAFDEAGVVILREFARADDCTRLKRRAFELIDGFDIGAHPTMFSTKDQRHAADDYFLNSGDKISFFLEEDAFGPDGRPLRAKRDSVNKIGHALHDLDPVFGAFSRAPEMAAAARAVGFVSPLLLQSMAIMKPAGVGGEVSCHQDSTFLYTAPESCVGFWVALDEATTANGCMEFIPGEHQKPLRRRFRRTEGGAEMIALSSDPYPEEQRVAAPAAIGDLVIFHGRAPHASRANRSEKPRMAYTLHLIEAQARYPQDNWLQRSADMPLKGF